MHIWEPVEPMLAALVDRLPTGEVWRYEPKWDGFRCLARVDPDQGVRLDSRRGKRLNGAFPDVVDAVSAELPASTVVDGEIVRWSEGGRLDFGALQRRNRAGDAGARKLAIGEPCHYIVFDLLEVAGTDLRREPLTRRRRELEELLGGGEPGSRLALGMQTDQEEQARQWLSGLSAVGVEGLIAKRADEPYRPGRRDWRKVKEYVTTEFVIGGVTGRLNRPDQLILGRYSTETGALVMAGRTVPLSDRAAAEVAAIVEPAGGDHPWPPMLPPGWHSAEPVRYERVVPEVVAEVRVDTAVEDHRWRHGLRFLRLRPDLTPEDVPTDLSLHG